MNSSEYQDILLAKIRKSIETNPQIENNEVNYNDNEIFHPFTKSPAETFKEELEKVNGNCIICDDSIDLNDKLKQLIKKREFKNIFCLDKDLQKILTESEINFSDKEEDFLLLETGVTGCEFLIARFGSIMVSSRLPSGRRLYVYPPVHIVIAYTSQIVNELVDAYRGITDKYKADLPSLISLITGPSRTADIEKTLILGAHGPKELFVFLVNDKNNL